MILAGLENVGTADAWDIPELVETQNRFELFPFGIENSPSGAPRITVTNGLIPGTGKQLLVLGTEIVIQDSGTFNGIAFRQPGHDGIGEASCLETVEICLGQGMDQVEPICHTEFGGADVWGFRDNSSFPFT